MIRNYQVSIGLYRQTLFFNNIDYRKEHIETGDAEGRIKIQIINQMKKLKHLTLEEKAYIAGFLEGDGCINAQIVRRPDYILKFQIRVSITFFQKTKHHWFLIWLQKKLKYGTLRKRPDQMSEYTIVGCSMVKNVLTELKTFLRLKQPQAKLLLTIIHNMPNIKNDPPAFLKLCEQVDQFIDLNASKKRHITATLVRSELGLKSNLFPLETET